VTDEHQSRAGDRSDPVRDVSDINPWARGGSMSKIPITTPSPEPTGESISKIPITTPAPEAAGGAVVNAATPRRSSRSSLIVIVALTGIVGVVLAITLRPWRDSPSTDDTGVAATTSIPVTSPAGTLPTPEAVVPVAGAAVVAEPDVDDRRGCGRPDVWVQVCDAANFGGAAMGAAMYAVTAGGPGLVAVGASVEDCCADFVYSAENETSYESEEYLDADAVVWTSVDGLTWSRVPHDEQVFGGPDVQQMISVTAGGPGLVAVGSERRVDEQGNAAVWTSVDGLTWTRVPDDEDVFGGPGEQQMISVTAGGPGLVAVGNDGAADNEQANAAVWTSVDGLTWTRVPDDEAVFGGQYRQRMLSVTAGVAGLVAVGSDGHPIDRYDIELAADAAVWTSPDGLTWSRVPHEEPVFGGPGEQQMNSVTVGGPGLVAVGSSEEEKAGPDDAADEPANVNHDAAVWTSPDGLTWSRVPHDEAVFAVSNTEGDLTEIMLSVTAGGPGLVAVGFDSADQCGWDAAVWTSPDGLTWSQVPSPNTCGRSGSYEQMRSVTDAGSGLVAVGWEWGESPGAAVWNS
jgi:hypothetical protein